ncbi:transferrin-binding protein-like solute binding protein [Yoonia sp. BS5-3]|uniref:Transferrin-binding protein-like solute binding protein n=1 Tax=Yoonia phaeophyticola TaxID=3137369 RepID=A0ABZ2V5S3_9RHOB
MNLRISSQVFLLAILGVSACSNSSSEANATPGTNGLDYGALGQELSDAEGAAVTMRSANFQTGDDTGATTATITLDEGFFNGDLDGTIEIFGETVVITDGVGKLANGQDVRLTYDSSQSGTYAAALDATVSEMSDINGGASYVLGFETNPDTVDARTGSVTYSGDFQVAGSLDGSTTLVAYEGDITVVVDFTADAADFELDGVLNSTTDVTMDASQLELFGNGISGDLECLEGCADSVSEVDATFYGPNADELGGILEINIEVDEDLYLGAGTFVITP